MSEADIVEQARLWSAALNHLVGKRIALASHAASMRGFLFESVPPTEDSGTWVLHIQCPWRIKVNGVILTGSGDWWEPVSQAVLAPDWTGPHF